MCPLFRTRHLPRLKRDPFEASGRVRARVITTAPVAKAQSSATKLTCSAVDDRREAAQRHDQRQILFSRRQDRELHPGLDRLQWG